MPDKAFSDLLQDSDSVGSIEQWLSSQRHESDSWLLREILSYKCRAKDANVKVPPASASLTIPQSLLECLLHTMVMLRGENERLVEKSKEHLANTRLDKASDDRLEALNEQLCIKDEMIADLKADVAAWQEKYLNSTETNQKLIEQTNFQQIECNNRLVSMQKANEDLQALVKKTENENQSLQSENRRLNGELFKVQAEVNALKKSAQSTDTLRKERLCCQQKVHVISERLYQCKEKLDECQTELRHKEALCELQTQQIQQLQTNVNQLKSNHDHLTQEMERCRVKMEETDKRLHEQEKSQQLLVDTQQSHRITELQLQRDTLNSLISINSAYEAELLDLRAQLALYEYELNQSAQSPVIRHSSNVSCAAKLECVSNPN